jgi:histone deacetylase complex regulatory component SIN3
VLYGDSGQEVVDVLRKNPASTLPIVLARLQQKDEEWRRVRLELSTQRQAVILTHTNPNKSLNLPSPMA